MSQPDLFAGVRQEVADAIKRKVLEERAKVVAYLRAANDDYWGPGASWADDIEQGKHDRG